MVAPVYPFITHIHELLSYIVAHQYSFDATAYDIDIMVIDLWNGDFSTKADAKVHTESIICHSVIRSPHNVAKSDEKMSQRVGFKQMSVRNKLR